eukprot:7178656-Alexandrium_andersonii.AAC.1
MGAPEAGGHTGKHRKATQPGRNCSKPQAAACSFKAVPSSFKRLQGVESRKPETTLTCRMHH